MFCGNCGKPLAGVTDQRFCAQCGKQVRDLPNPARQCSSTGTSRVKQALAIGVAPFIVIGVAVAAIAFFSPEHQELKSARTDEPVVAEDRKAVLRKQLDPVTAQALSPTEHLHRAKLLLTQVDVQDYEKTDVVFSLVEEHCGKAEQEPSLRPHVKAIRKEFADKAVQALQHKAWQSDTALFAAEWACEAYITRRLKAPSTADFQKIRSGRWNKHPGQFLVTYAVDAENSFGAKLRSTYECQVACLTEKNCGVSKMYEARP